MDPCTKETCSNTDNVVEPPTLLYLSNSILVTHFGKLNMSIYDKDPNVRELGLEPTNKMDTDLKTDVTETFEMTDQEMTNVAVHSTTKKKKSYCMKMSGIL